MKISKNTQLCISIAQRPGNFGTKLFNKAFAALHLDYLYKAMPLNSEGDLEGAVRGIRALGIRGCGVSMPFKEKILPFLDVLDETAKKTGAINTIVNDLGVLIGYNTDYLGARTVLKRECDLQGQKVLVCGLGGVARAIVLALHDLGADTFVTGRNKEKVIRFVETVPAKVYPWADLFHANGYLFVNATPVGMTPDESSSIIPISVAKKFKVIFDVVINPLKTLLITLGLTEGIKVIPGHQMALEQALEQFRLYTGQEAPRKELETLFG